MRFFYDNEHQKWAINLTWDIAEEIYKRVERPDSTPESTKTFDLFNITDKDQIDCFNTHDMYTGRFDLKKGKCLINMLYVICEEQCIERGVSDVQFGQMLQGSPFSNAINALMEEIKNFIQDPVRKTMFQNLLSLADGGQLAVLSEASQILDEKTTALRANATQMLKNQIEPVWTQVMQEMENAVAAPGMTNSSNTAVVSASHPET